MKPVEPILVADLFPEMRIELMNLLASFSPEEWEKPTVCEGWSVKDIAAHLWGDDIGILSHQRDQHPVNAHITGWESLVTFINERNEVWVQATRRLSPILLCELLNVTAPQVEVYFQSLDPFAIGNPVSWAGDHPMPKWMDIAREYTERWLHQQHIRDAVNRPGLKERKFLYPLLDTFVRAMPHTYRNIQAPADTLLKVVIGDDEWMLVRHEDGWQLYRETDLPPTTVIRIDSETAWRLFTKGIDGETANITFEGEVSLGVPILKMVSIIA